MKFGERNFGSEHSQGLFISYCMKELAVVRVVCLLPLHPTKRPAVVSPFTLFSFTPFFTFRVSTLGRFLLRLLAILHGR